MSADGAEAASIPPGARLFPDIVYGEARGVKLHLDLVVPEDSGRKRPCVVWLHGGGWREGTYKENSAAFLAGRGYVVTSVQYRFSHQAIFPAQLHDCKAAIRWLRANASQRGIDPERIGVWGLSAGAHLALLLGTTDGVESLEGSSGSPGYCSRVQAVCDFCGPTDLTRFPSDIGQEPRPVNLLLGGTARDKPELAKLASPLHHVSPGDAPVLMVHGELDELAPIRESELLYGALNKAGVDATFIRVKNAGHGFLGDIEPTPDEIDRIVLAFFDKWLKP